VIIADRNRRKVEAFTFGGKLNIDSAEQVTVASLTSPAPIFDLMPPHSVPCLPLLVEETEILLAERRAAWAEKPEAFEVKLLVVDPLKLYAACLAGLLERLANHPDEPLGPYRSLSRLVQHLIETGRQIEDWPETLPDLEALL
jgi:hypothetical protein